MAGDGTRTLINAPSGAIEFRLANNTADALYIASTGLVGIGTTTPVVSLDLSKESDAIALPVGTNGNRPTTVNLASGEIRYNTATPAVEYYNGTTWVPLDSSGTSIGSGIVLGTSVTVPNPYASATDMTTGLYTSGPGHVDVTVTGVQEMDWSAAGQSLSGQSAQAIKMFRETTAATAGNNLTVQAGGAVSVGTNLNGGNLILASGIATGTGSSNIQFNTYNAGSTGTTDDTAFTALTLSATGTTGVSPVTTLQANNGSGTNQNGGTLTLASGVSTGTGTSNINFNVYGAGSTGPAANSATTAMTIASTGYVGIGTTSPFGVLHVNGGDIYFGNELNNTTSLRVRRNGVTIGGFSSVNSIFSLFGGSTAASHLTISTSGLVGVGTTNPASTLAVNGGVAIGTTYAATNAAGANNLIVQGSVGIGTTSASGSLNLSGSQAYEYLDSGGSSFNAPSEIIFRRAEGSITSPTAVNSGDWLLFVGAKGYGATGYGANPIDGIIARATENFSDTSNGNALDFGTAANGTTSRVVRMTIDQSGYVGIGSTSPVVSLDLSQEHDAIALPVGTNGNRPTTVNLASGEIRYNTATPAVEYYNGTTWVPLDSSGTSIGSGIVLGTSVTVPNPYASATDMTTGLYTSGPGHVDVTSAGTQVADFSSSGFNVVVGSVGIGTSSPGTTLDVNGSLRTGNLRIYSASGSLTQSVGDYLTLGTFTTNNGSFLMEVDVADNGTAASSAKKFMVVGNYDDYNSSSWYQILPIADTGQRGGGDYILDIQGSTGTMRIRRTVADSNSAATIFATIKVYESNTFTVATATGTGATVSGLYRQSTITQNQSNVGIGTTAPGFTLDVNGSIGVGNNNGSGSTNKLYLARGETLAIIFTRQELLATICILANTAMAVHSTGGIFMILQQALTE